jgi:hypothetical protein
MDPRAILFARPVAGQPLNREEHVSSETKKYRTSRRRRTDTSLDRCVHRSTVKARPGEPPPGRPLWRVALTGRARTRRSPRPPCVLDRGSSAEEFGEWVGRGAAKVAPCVRPIVSIGAGTDHDDLVVRAIRGGILPRHEARSPRAVGCQMHARSWKTSRGAKSSVGPSTVYRAIERDTPTSQARRLRPRRGHHTSLAEREP